MDEDDPRNRRLTFGRGCDWKAPDVSPELFPGSPLPNFATPQARYDYERGLAEREFRVRLKTAGNWGFVQIQGLDINLKDAGLAAHELSMVTAGFLDQSLRAYGNLLLDLELPQEEALRQFDEKASELAEESFRYKWCQELAAMHIEESTQHIHFDRATTFIGEVRRDLTAILWEIAIEKPFAPERPSDEHATGPEVDGAECAVSLVEPRRLTEEAAAAPQNTTAKRRGTQPTPEQTRVAEKSVAEQSAVTTQIAAWWLPCSLQHMRRLARESHVSASKTRPMHITTNSLRTYKWHRTKSGKPKDQG